MNYVFFITWISIFALSVLFSKKNFKWVLLFSVLSFAFLAYNMKLTPNMDVTRILNSMQYWYRNDFQWFIENKLVTDPVSNLYFYMLGLLGDEHLIPAVSVTITYGFSMALLWKCFCRFNLKHTDMVFLLFVVLGNITFFYVASNMRIYMCYAIIAYFTYTELIENKNHVLAPVFYVICIFFHYACVPFVLFRYLAGRYKKFNLRVILGVCVLLVIFSQLENILNLLHVSGGLLYTIQYKVKRYSTYDTFGPEYFLNSIIKALGFITLLAMTILSSKRYSERACKMVYFAFLTAILYIVMMSNYQMVIRLPSMLAMIIIPVFSILSSESDKQSLMFPHARTRLQNNKHILMIILSITTLSNILFEAHYLIAQNVFFEG